MAVRILAILLFLFAIILRLWNLNMMGRTWDEQNIVEKGYNLVQLALNKDFSNPFWYDNPDHPPLSNYLYGVASVGDFVRFDKNEIISFRSSPYGAGIFHYDFAFTRLVSVFFSSLAVVLVFLIGARYISLFVGITAGIILAMMPHFLGYSQLVTHESLITFFFTASVFSYLLYFEKKTTLLLIISGILTGLTLELKQSNVLLFVLLFGLFLLWKYLYPKKKTINLRHIISISLIGIATYIVLWPMPIFHLDHFITFTYDMWFKNGGKVPTLLFGLPIGAPFFFYIVAFFVTTPLIILLLSLFGLKAAWKKRLWIFLAITLWFLIPFLMSLFSHRQMMVRYIIEFYAPLSLLAAIGLESLVNKFTQKHSLKYLAVAFLAGYLFLILLQISPYYLDYYNELVGGTNGVYKQKLFFLGEWGQGLRNPGMYVATHASKDDVIGLALNPKTTLYQSPQLTYEDFDAKRKYDYVIVNTFNVLRLGFDESILQKDYRIVYEEKADKAVLARVYKRK
jgi:4-amino-4-deoxy-L-arabinose transferase-like glycosyltransferase